MPYGRFDLVWLEVLLLLCTFEISSKFVKLWFDSESFQNRYHVYAYQGHCKLEILHFCSYAVHLGKSINECLLLAFLHRHSASDEIFKPTLDS